MITRRNKNGKREKIGVKTCFYDVNQRCAKRALIFLTEIAFVRAPAGAEGLRTKVQQHNILIKITGANVTNSALVEKAIEDAYVSQHVALVRLKDVSFSNFLFHSVVSQACRQDS